jgi:Insertion element 4 transposase N-terminal/Transposase DDE domain
MKNAPPESAADAPRLTDKVAMGALTRIVRRDIVDAVLAETGRAEKRSRLLPAHVVVYFVMAMAVFRDGYEELLRKLVGGLQFMGNWSQGWRVPTTGAVSQARHRLGEQPLRELFGRVAVPLARSSTAGAWLRSWRLMAIDGVQIDVPDTPENLAAFGKYRDGTRRPFPQIRSVGLGECGTHALVAAQFGGIHDGERALAAGLLGAVEPDMLVIADRGFFSFELWQQYLLTRAALLWRVSATIKLTPTRVLVDGSYLATIASKRVRGSAYQIPLSAVDDPREATHIPVRVIEYTITGHGNDRSEVFRLVTSILDPEQASALELAGAYQQRWEHELALREIETQLLEPGGGLRSKTPELVRQELWGLLLTHYAIRALMVEAADIGEIDPDRLSFLRTLNIVRRQVIDQAGFSPRHDETGNDPRHR